MQDIITYILIAIAVAILAVRIYRVITGKRKCNGCDGQCKCCNNGEDSGCCKENNNKI